MEDKREVVRRAEPFEHSLREAYEQAQNRLEVARERARLSVLTLTPRDKRFLQSLKVKGD